MKQWQEVPSIEELPFLSDAVAEAQKKAWYLNNRRHYNVTDPTLDAAALKRLDKEIGSYLDAKSGCKKT